jgi:hypothetical protein
MNLLQRAYQLGQQRCILEVGTTMFDIEKPIPFVDLEVLVKEFRPEVAALTPEGSMGLRASYEKGWNSAVVMQAELEKVKPTCDEASRGWEHEDRAWGIATGRLVAPEDR